jgi:hypothetical protein
VLCTKRMESLQITFFFIVKLLVPFGMSSSNVSGCLGLCRDELLICLLVGGLPTALEVPLFGR